MKNYLLDERLNEQEQLKVSIEYCRDKILSFNTENWEKKEYDNVLAMNQKRLKELTIYIIPLILNEHKIKLLELKSYNSIKQGE